jgi:ATP-dependent Lon protease
VLFPGPTIPVAVGRAVTLRAVDAALKGDRTVFAVAQRQPTDDVEPDQLYSMGVIARIDQVQRGLGGLQLLLTGEQRAFALDIRPDDLVLRAIIRPVDDMPPLDDRDAAFAALYREVRERAVELGKQRGLTDDVLRQVVDAVDEPGRFSDLVATYLDLPLIDQQSLLETLSIEDRLRRVLVHLQRQIDVLAAQLTIRNKVAEELQGRQREMYLREQLKAIQSELGEDGGDHDVVELRDKLAKLDLPEEARAEADRELVRLERAGRESVEAQVIRTYLQWIVELPWNTRSDDRLDLDHAQRVLDEDHYGLADVKDRVLEFLSIRDLQARREPDAKARAVARGPILLFVGPPGVGKTSIAKSIARALGRKYVRVSLGGTRDEAEIRGHRRTYVGALPGRILQGLKHAGTKNPVFLLDEVDKLGISFQGDPASALLEVLDPAQNSTFTDHYLGVPFDLSEVLFVATANVTHTIAPPLTDRMETVEFAGYTEREKLEIARRYLVLRQRDDSGLAELAFTDDALGLVIASYTHESGVRQLERQIGAVARKLARRVASHGELPSQIGAELVRELLGRPRVHPEHAGESDEVGVATGMYYTPAGGDIMFVEAAVRMLHLASAETEIAGLGAVSLILTGQLGDVMKESARAALTYAATHARTLAIPDDKLGSIEVHVHVPAGAIPKDGPSAGVTIATALVSAMAGRQVRRDVAMTGEITLRGRVLPIGGIKEKVLGAHRAGIHHVILPRQNDADLEDVPPEVRAALELHLVDTLDDVFAIALLGGTRDATPPRDRPIAGVRSWSAKPHQ